MTPNLTRRTALKLGAVGIGATMLPARVTAQEGMSLIQAYTGHTSSFYSVHFGDGMVYGSSASTDVLQINAGDMSLSNTYSGHSSFVYDVFYGSDGFVYSASADEEIHKIDPSDMSLTDTYSGHFDEVQSVFYGSDGFLYSASNDNQTHKIDPDTLTLDNSFDGHNGIAERAILAEDGFVYTCDRNGDIYQLNTGDMSENASATDYTGQYFWVAYGGGFVWACGGSPTRLDKIDPTTMDIVNSYTDHDNSILVVDYGDDGYVYTGSADNEIHQVDPDSLTTLHTYTEHAGRVEGIHFADDENLYSGARDDEVHQIDTGTEVIDPGLDDPELRVEVRKHFLPGQTLPYRVRHYNGSVWNNVTADANVTVNDDNILTQNAGNYTITANQTNASTGIKAAYDGLEVEKDISVASVLVEHLDLLPFSRKTQAMVLDSSVQGIFMSGMVGAVVARIAGNPWVGVFTLAGLFVILWAWGVLSTGMGLIAIFFAMLAGMVLLNVDRQPSINIRNE